MMGWIGLGGVFCRGGLFWVWRSALVSKWFMCFCRDWLCVCALVMSSFLSQPGMGMVMWVFVLGCGAGWGLCGIALDEGGEVFGDGHVVCVCLGHQLTLSG